MLNLENYSIIMFYFLNRAHKKKNIVVVFIYYLINTGTNDIKSIYIGYCDVKTNHGQT